MCQEKITIKTVKGKAKNTRNTFELVHSFLIYIYLESNQLEMHCSTIIRKAQSYVHSTTNK